MLPVCDQWLLILPSLPCPSHCLHPSLTFLGEQPGWRCCGCQGQREGKEGHREENSRLPGAVEVSVCRRKQRLESQQPVTVFQTQQGSAVWQSVVCVMRVRVWQGGRAWKRQLKITVLQCGDAWRGGCWHLAGAPQVCAGCCWDRTAPQRPARVPAAHM